MNISPAIEEQWLEWQKHEHIPEIMATGLFSEYKFYRLLDQDNSGGKTYIIQYFTSSIEHYNEYVKQYSAALRNKAVTRWGDQFISFRSVMEVVN